MIRYPLVFALALTAAGWGASSVGLSALSAQAKPGDQVFPKDRSPAPCPVGSCGCTISVKKVQSGWCTDCDCGEFGQYITWEITLVCGGVTCKFEVTACQNDSAPVTLTCNGKNVKVSPDGSSSNGVWGDVKSCKDLKTTC